MTIQNRYPRRAKNHRWRLLAILMLGPAGLAGVAFWNSRRPVDYTTLPPSQNMSIRIDISERTLYATVDGAVRTYEIAVGSPNHPTPRGSYAIGRIIWNPSWNPPDSEWARGAKPARPGDPSNPMGRVKMYFREPAYYIHGTPDESSLGRAVSHGCVRLSNPDAIELARLVMEHGGAAREPGWIERVLDRARSTKQVRLSNPVPVRIAD